MINRLSRCRRKFFSKFFASSNVLEMSNVQHRWSMKHRYTWHANYLSYRIFKIVLKPNLASCVGALLILFHFTRGGMYAALFARRSRGKARRCRFFWFRRNNTRLHVFAVCVSRTRVNDYFSGCGRSAFPSPSLLFLFLFLFPPHKGVMIN